MLRSTVNLTQTKHPLGPAPKGQIEKGRGRKLSKAAQHFVGWFPGLACCRSASGPLTVSIHIICPVKGQSYGFMQGEIKKPDRFWSLWLCYNHTHVRMQPQTSNIKSFLSGLTGPEACLMSAEESLVFGKQRVADHHQVRFSLCLLVFPATAIRAHCGLCFTVTEPILLLIWCETM